MTENLLFYFIFYVFFTKKHEDICRHLTMKKKLIKYNQISGTDGTILHHIEYYDNERIY